MNARNLLPILFLAPLFARPAGAQPAATPVPGPAPVPAVSRFRRSRRPASPPDDVGAPAQISAGDLRECGIDSRGAQRRRREKDGPTSPASRGLPAAPPSPGLAAARRTPGRRGRRRARGFSPSEREASSEAYTPSEPRSKWMHRHSRGGGGEAVRLREASLRRMRMLVQFCARCGSGATCGARGRQAPEFGSKTASTGRPGGDARDASRETVVMFFWAEWCGDCKAQAAGIQPRRQKYARRASRSSLRRALHHRPREEKRRPRKVWKEGYGALHGGGSDQRRGAAAIGSSATPTLYSSTARGSLRSIPDRMTNEERLSAAIGRFSGEAGAAQGGRRRSRYWSSRVPTLRGGPPFPE